MLPQGQVCGKGQQKRENRFCGADNSKRFRNFPCTVPCQCVVSDWTLQGSCVLPNNQTCGTGAQNYTRTIVTQGANCPRDLTKQEPCSVPCPCQVGPWTKWGVCKSGSNLCFTGTRPPSNATRTRSRIVTVPGENCPPLLETVACKLTECYNKNALQSDYQGWPQEKVSALRNNPKMITSNQLCPNQHADVLNIRSAAALEAKNLMGTCFPFDQYKICHGGECLSGCTSPVCTTDSLYSREDGSACRAGVDTRRCLEEIREIRK